MELAYQQLLGAIAMLQSLVEDNELKQGIQVPGKKPPPIEEKDPLDEFKKE